MHKPIQFKDLCFSLPHKLCFKQFSGSISYGQRIGVIGQNGSGKSTLLRMLQGLVEPTEGELRIPQTINIGYIPQVITELKTLSGGQRFHEKLTQVLGSSPSILLLDEPTNHLDDKNRQSLMRMLRLFPGTLIIVTHDVALLEQVINTIWHIDQDKVRIFTGTYKDYQHELAIEYQTIEQELVKLSRQKKGLHQTLMKEQVRAKHSRLGGEKKVKDRKWPTVVSSAKLGRGNETANRKRSEINAKSQVLKQQLSTLRLPEIIKPTFSIQASKHSRVQVCINNGSVGFEMPILTAINLSISNGERLAISGNNGAGKSTLIRALLRDEQVVTTGDWQLLNRDAIGYLDQHYSTLNPEKTVLETIQDYVPAWSYIEIRKHLNDFLFRKNNEINALVASLSGGEKARLSLAQIAAITPKLLILDEITNNLDLETKAHVIQVLKDYPGTLVVISHEADFLSAIGITSHYFIQGGLLKSKMEAL